MALIMLDPGHGGTEPGAVANGVREADVNLPISQLVAATIRSMGVQVGLTRTGDVSLLKDARVRAAIEGQPTCIVSIHANAATSVPTARGPEVYVSAFDPRSEALGIAISKELSRLPLPARQPPVRTRTQTDGLTDWYYIIRDPLRLADIPAVLVETGFLTNSEDAAYLSTFWGQFQVAYHIGQGVLRWLGIPDPDELRGELSVLKDRLERVWTIVNEGRCNL